MQNQLNNKLDSVLGQLASISSILTNLSNQVASLSNQGQTSNSVSSGEGTIQPFHIEAYLLPEMLEWNQEIPDSKSSK